ncbi:unnamed protein product, partial [Onchocerca ochengi]
LLNADDRQLNAWASLKKATAYRSEAEELYDIKAYKKKALNILKKKRIFSTDFGGKISKKLAEDNVADDMKHTYQTGKISTKKKKRSSQKFPKDVDTRKQEESSTVAQENHLKNAHNCKNHSMFEQFSSTVDIDDSRLRAYGINPKKYKNKLFRQQQNCTRKSVKRYQ